MQCIQPQPPDFPIQRLKAKQQFICKANNITYACYDTLHTFKSNDINGVFVYIFWDLFVEPHWLCLCCVICFRSVYQTCQKKDRLIVPWLDQIHIFIFIGLDQKIVHGEEIQEVHPEIKLKSKKRFNKIYKF